MSTPNEHTTATSANDHDSERHCRFWGGGHCVHWVQGMRSNNPDQPGEYVACMVTEASGDGWFTLVITSTGEEFRYWNHDPVRVRGLVGRSNLEVNQRWSVLHRRLSSGGSTDYVAISTKARPCVFDDPEGPLHEQLETHGGFSISGPDALRLIAETNGKDDTTGTA